MPRTGETCRRKGEYRCECRSCRRPPGREITLHVEEGSAYPPCPSCFGVAAFSAANANDRSPDGGDG
jgi:hypothetical protein